VAIRHLRSAVGSLAIANESLPGVRHEKHNDWLHYTWRSSAVKAQSSRILNSLTQQRRCDEGNGYVDSNDPSGNGHVSERRVTFRDFCRLFSSVRSQYVHGSQHNPCLMEASLLGKLMQFKGQLVVKL
jgi:hypothetical protein